MYKFKTIKIFKEVYMWFNHFYDSKLIVLNILKEAVLFYSFTVTFIFKTL